MTASGEERFIAEFLEPLASGFPGAFDLRDDCAEIRPLPGHSLIFKTDPIVEGVHFFKEDAPEDLAWKALAVNVSDLAAKAARPVAYLMALTLPSRPAKDWITRFASGLQAAQEAFGCVLIGGDTDQRDGPLSIAITVIGELPSGRMVQRSGAVPGDLIYVSGELGGAALGLRLRLDSTFACDQITLLHRNSALARYLRPAPSLGLRAALAAYARSAMDISDGLVKDLDRMCRLTGFGAEIELASVPTAAGIEQILQANETEAARLVTSGDDYEVLATVPPLNAVAFEQLARSGGGRVTNVGRVVAQPGVILNGQSGPLTLGTSGYDHFDKISSG